ncbi:MAG: hypothetical protein WBA41_22005 [Rivularia sp. (in: cyanobacteria)]
MSQKKKFVKKQGQVYRSLVASALVANGVFQFVAPVLAQTAAGGTISNTATATYEDDDDPNTPPINATSNTVTVTVAEVAGITVEGVEIPFKDGGDNNSDDNYNATDEFYFVYDVTNVGNDPTKFKIPDAPEVNGPGTLDGKVQIKYADGDWIDIDNPSIINGETRSIAPGEVVKVRVPVRVNDNAKTGEQISVKLGDTPNDAQNQPYAAGPDPSGNKDVFTVDNADNVTDETPGELTEAQAREASATQTVTVDASDKSYALAKVLKTNDNYTSAGADGPVGDTLDYNLSLEVLSSDPTQSGINPTALEGTDITIDGTSSKNILVSDAIPSGTKLANVPTPAPGWAVIYSTQDATTIKANAVAANWTATAPGNLAEVRRVGFVRTGSVPTGTTVPGFKIKVEVISNANSVTIANVAQLFGESPNGSDVYDESGDQQPSNYDEVDKLFPGTIVQGEVPNEIPDDQIDDGYIDPTDADGNGTPDELEGPNGYGTDVNNNNSGAGKGGEANVYKINLAAVSSVLNGPENAPNAEVNGDNNIDFTNKSAAVPAGIAPGGTVTDPGTVSFTNTVQNTGNSNADIILEPQVPAATLGSLPTTGTTLITLTYDNNGTETEQKAVYSYDGTNLTLTSSERGGAADTTPTPIKILAVASNDTRNYTVAVDLPDNTDLSTNDGVERGYPVPIRAFVDNNDDGVADIVDSDNDPATDNNIAAENVTIDRVYVGYLKLFKESRILNPDGSEKVAFSIDNKSPAPGEIIEYRITYNNISEEPDTSSPGNVVLNAKNVVITEDGTTGGNNWALDNDNDGALDTVNVSGTAKVVDEADNPTTDATIAYDPADDETTTSYTVTAVEVAPGVLRKFTFQRRVNQVSPTGTPDNGTGATAPDPDAGI